MFDNRPVFSYSRMHPPSKALAPGFSAPQFRAALGMFATGVTVVAARQSNGDLIGVTANSFSSVSLDPPLVLWSLAARASSLGIFRAGARYAISVLAVEQQGLAERFSAKGKKAWDEVPYDLGPGGAPIIRGACASFECFNRSRYEEGDHVIFVGQVERCTMRADASPLLFHGGKFYTEHPL